MGNGCISKDEEVHEPHNRQIKQIQQNSFTDSKQEELCQLIYNNNKKLTRHRRSQNISSQNLKINSSGSQHSNKRCYSKHGTRYMQENSAKLKLIELNKNFVGESIETSKCVQHALKLLEEREILKSSQYNLDQKLQAKNLKGMINKENRYKNLVAKIKLVESEYHKKSKPKVFEQYRNFVAKQRLLKRQNPKSDHKVAYRHSLKRKRSNLHTQATFNHELSLM